MLLHLGPPPSLCLTSPRKRCTFFHRPATYQHPIAVCKIREIFPLERCSMLFALVSRGKNPGTRLFPHRSNDNPYPLHLRQASPYLPITHPPHNPPYLHNDHLP